MVLSGSRKSGADVAVADGRSPSVQAANMAVRLRRLQRMPGAADLLGSRARSLGRSGTCLLGAASQL